MNRLLNQRMPLLGVFLLLSLFAFYGACVSVTPEVTFLLKEIAPWDVLDYEKNPFAGTGSKPEFIPPLKPYTREQSQKTRPSRNNSSNNHLPKSFLPQEGECIKQISNMGSCRSGYAISVADALADRMCKLYGAEVELSSQEIISCSDNHGCQGGYSYLSYVYAEEHGLALSECIPYTSKNGEVEQCPSRCKSGDEIREKYRCKPGTLEDLSGDTVKIKTELLERGPVTMVMRIYEDFLYYRGGIYKHVYGPEIELHAVRCVGFGYDDTAHEYWLCANSWGTQWGMRGWFRIGETEAEIQRDVQTCIPEKIAIK